MPFIPLKFKPGVNRDQTNYSNEGGWYECDKIRFRSGFPQKIGGWLKYTPTAFLGVCRQLFNWVTSYTDNFLALGTNLKVYLEAGGVFYNITPWQGSSGVGDVTFAATNGSSIITVTDVTVAPVYAITAGNYVTFENAASLGGNITADVLNQNYEIKTVISATQYTIDVSVQASASDSGNGGPVAVAHYEIEVGNASTIAGYGWGTSVWGGDPPPRAWGVGSTEPASLPQRDWWFDNFDNDLVMNIRDGAIYYWERGTNQDPSVALATPAIYLPDLATTKGFDGSKVPIKAMQILVSQNDKHLITFGSIPYGSTNAADFDPLLIRWASQDNPFQWTQSPLTSAGDIKVSRGSYIVRALPTRQEILVWTNSHLYSLQFTGTTDVFALQELADNISIIGPRAMASANNVTYWMGQDKFYAYSGRVETLPCSLRNFVFNDINRNASGQIICGTNEGWNEIWWIYASASSNWNNRYVIFNHLEKIWYYGNIEKTSWLDSALRQYPQTTNTPENSTTGYLYNQEYGLNEDTLPMEAYIQSSDFDIGDGEKFMLSRRLIPDLDFSGTTANNAEVTFGIKSRNFPGKAEFSDTDDSRPIIETSVNQYQGEVFIRTRARQLALRISSVDLNVQWQLGTPRLDVREDGKR